MAHPFFEQVVYPWDRQDARTLHEKLYKTEPNPQRIDILYRKSGPDLLPLALQAAPDVVWRDVLNQLTAARKLRELFRIVLDAPNLAAAYEAVHTVMDAKAAIEEFVLKTENASDILFVNRKDLRIEIDKLASSSPSTRVLLIRGDSKSGRTWTRHLLESRAAELGEGPIVYIYDGNVADVSYVLRVLFLALDQPNEIPPRNSSENAWYMDALYKMQEIVSGSKRRMWIVADDLGLGDDGPKLNPAIRKFFEQFALQMGNPSFAQWFRLVLIEYPRGNIPTKWKKGSWLDEDTGKSAPRVEDLALCLREWAQKKRKNLPLEQAQEFAAEILGKALAGNAADPRASVWEIIHDELLSVLKKT